MNSELLTMATKWIDNCFLTPSQLRRSYQGNSVKWKTDTCKGVTVELTNTSTWEHQNHFFSTEMLLCEKNQKYKESCEEGITEPLCPKRNCHAKEV